MLKLNADWVILSAGNGGRRRQEMRARRLVLRARSSMLGAIIAGVVLVREFCPDGKASYEDGGRAKIHPKIGRAEALGQTTQSMIDGGKEYEAYSAPVVPAGEAAAAR